MTQNIPAAATQTSAPELLAILDRDDAGALLRRIQSGLNPRVEFGPWPGYSLATLAQRHGADRYLWLFDQFPAETCFTGWGKTLRPAADLFDTLFPVLKVQASRLRRIVNHCQSGCLEATTTGLDLSRQIELGLPVSEEDGFIVPFSVDAEAQETVLTIDGQTEEVARPSYRIVGKIRIFSPFQVPELLEETVEFQPA